MSLFKVNEMRSRIIITSFILMLSSIFMVGCGAKLPSIKPYKMEIQQGNVVTSKMLLQLRPGMTKSQVRYIMGTPLIVDSFHDNRWDYFYQLRQEGKVIEKRRVILDFDKDALVSVRGDVVAAGDKTAEAPTNTAPKSVNSPKKEESKSWLDRLKFWKSDEEKQGAVEAAVEAPAAVEVIKDKSAEEAKAIGKEAAEPVLAAPAELASPAPEAATESILKKEIELAPKVDEVPAVSAAAAVVTAIPSEPILEKEIKAAPAVTEPEVAQADPAPAVSNVDDTQGSDELSKQAVLASFEAWADAWRNKNFEQYIGAYAESFKPDGLVTRKAWVAQRKVRVAKRKGDIKLEFEDMDVQVTGNKANVQFFQKYSSKVYSDEVTKQLDFVLDTNTRRWLIVKESVVAEGRRPTLHKILAPEGTDEHLEGIIERIGF
jgi:outer membrane protein assembly factor BamE (lipoprotein component of BamABCDE complex)/ketosteroid isomerase-like protein